MDRSGALDQLLARPIAHRGLHDAASGVIENSASAVALAAQSGYGIEVDVQASADGEALVFHDDTLDRLTAFKGEFSARPARDLVVIPLRGSAEGDRIWTLEECLALVAGRVPLVVEIKSRGDGDTRLASRVGRMLAAYSGPVAAKSFDPRMVMTLRRDAPSVLRGVIGCAFDRADWPTTPFAGRFALRHLLHWPRTRPDFLSWDVHDLPRLSVTLARRFSEAPVMSWTVRTLEEQARASFHADQMVFEGFRP